MPLRSGAADDSAPLSELLCGDRVEVLELADHRAWGRSLTDGAVGYFDAEQLGPDGPAPTHIVTARAAPLTAEPYPDAPGTQSLPMGSLIHGAAGPEGYIDTHLGYLSTDDVCALDALTGTAADWAEAMIGLSYRAGGRSGAGVDSGGMIFLAHQLAGIAAPRFVDLQAQAIGTPFDPTAPLRRGDMLFFAGHALIMVDAESAVHVSEGHGVVKESLESVIESGAHGPVIAQRRVA